MILIFNNYLVAFLINEKYKYIPLRKSTRMTFTMSRANNNVHYHDYRSKATSEKVHDGDI